VFINKQGPCMQQHVFYLYWEIQELNASCSARRSRQFLSNSYFQSKLGASRLQVDNTEDFANIIWDSKDWKKVAFGQKNTTKYNVC
jgi:hypothetical protein